MHDRGFGFDSRGAALGIWPDAWAGLVHRGVVDRLHDYRPYSRATIRSDTGEPLGHVPLTEIQRRHGQPVMLVARPDLMDALAATYLSCGGESVGFGRRFTTPAEAGEYDLVVGADGINSAVWTFVLPTGSSPRQLGAAAWRGSGDGSAGPWGEIWGRGVFAGVTPVGRSRTNWYVCHAVGLDVPDRAAWHALVRSWPAPLATAVTQTHDDDLPRHDLLDLPPLPTYVRGSVALVGDAAHAMAPSLGRGAWQAIMDAVALIEVLATGMDVEEALHRYDTVMRPTGNPLVRRSRTLLRLQQAPRGAGIRNAAMKALRPVAPR